MKGTESVVTNLSAIVELFKLCNCIVFPSLHGEILKQLRQIKANYVSRSFFFFFLNGVENFINIKDNIIGKKCIGRASKSTTTLLVLLLAKA